VHPRLPPPGRNAPGFRAPLQRPLPGPVTKRENSATPRVREVPLCQPTRSSRLTSSTGPTAGITSTRQLQQPRHQHHQPRRHSSPKELHAAVVTSISLLA
jgi:hypothetical protein